MSITRNPSKVPNFPEEVTSRLRAEGGLRVNHVWSSTEPGKLEEVKEASVAGGGEGEGR